MSYKTCTNCKEGFQDTNTAEQRLLAAIFGEEHLCPKCTKDLKWSKCTTCGKSVEHPILYNNEPYHPYCLPFGE